MFMGCCFSSSSSSSSTEYSSNITAKVITLSGALQEYPAPATTRVSSVPVPSSCFLCSSDVLHLDAYIQPMDSEDVLERGQIYFLLPRTKLPYPLSASDMAALAVRAASALSLASEKQSKRRRRRLVPVSEACQEDIVDVQVFSKSSWQGYARLVTIEEADEH
ncbi:uncharacterized protein M6B38_204465 [Iris pallida]|uniref:Uncharacterized protein n=1 Tax=Iris pallida TaxID=29817 RepID=A0AAX6E778_IRIPA|nr:uncharacterized protein M6B38_204465 [Iris pallida]